MIQQFVVSNLSFAHLCLDQINFIDIQMHDKGMGGEISIVRHDTKLQSINFFGKNKQKATHFFAYGLFCFVEFFCLKVIFKYCWVEGVVTLMPIGYNLKSSLK
jgi:hypothetical protein